MQYHCFVILFSGSLFSATVSESSYNYSKDYYNDDSKDAVYSDFEANLTGDYDWTTNVTAHFTPDLNGDNSRTQGALPSIANCTFTFIKGVLNVTFMPTDVGGDCTIRLLGQLDLGSIRHSVKAMESVIFKRNEFVEGEKYSISIKCDNFMVSHCTEEVFLDGYKTSVRNCTDWNVSVGLFPDHRMHHMTAQVTPKQGYELCFKKYKVELRRFNVKCQTDLSLNKTEEVPFKNETMDVKFKDLLPGKYCAMVTAYHQNCFNNVCGIRLYEKPEELQVPNYNDPLELQQEKTSLLVIILPIGIICTVFVVGFIATNMLKNSLIYQATAVKSSCEKEPAGNSVPSEEKVVVAVLNAECVEPQREVLHAIHNFLKDCCNVHPVIAENNPEVFINSSAWIQKYFNYKHLSSNTIKHKVLVLETDASARLYNHWRSFGKEQEVFPTHLHYSPVNDVFLRGLTELLSSPEFLGTDHYHIVVARFPYSSNEISCFKQKRIYLPDQTVELYNSLWDSQDLLYDNVSLKNKWANNAAYKDLLRTIEQMNKYVEQNPQYLDNFVFGHTESV